MYKFRELLGENGVSMELLDDINSFRIEVVNEFLDTKAKMELMRYIMQLGNHVSSLVDRAKA